MRYDRRHAFSFPMTIAALATVGLLMAGGAAAKFCWDYTGLTATNPRPWFTICDTAAGDVPCGGGGTCVEDATSSTGGRCSLGPDDGSECTLFCYPDDRIEFGCDGSDPNFARGTTAGQLIGDEHRNWHCSHPRPEVTDSADVQELWGREFTQFHRQFILDYDVFRLSLLGIERLGIWDPFQDAPVVGDNEDTATAYTHCGATTNTGPNAHCPGAGRCLADAGSSTGGSCVGGLSAGAECPVAFCGGAGSCDLDATSSTGARCSGGSLSGIECTQRDCGAGSCVADATSSTGGSCSGGATNGAQCTVASCGGGGVCTWDLTSTTAGACVGGTEDTIDCAGSIRPAGAVCSECITLPAKFTVAGGLTTNFDNLGEIGFALERDADFTPPDEWHASYHIGVGNLGCADLKDGLTTPRDPAFWLAHNKLDEVLQAWMGNQPTDLVIVLDSSGSMNDNCPGGTADPGETPCAINDAKDAARALADVIADDVPHSGLSHRVGLVSFSSSASELLVAEGGSTLEPATGLGSGSPFDQALDNLTEGGATSIAAGVREAIGVLTGVADPNPHQSILVLTDGKENTAPCLNGEDEPEPAAEDCVSADELTTAEVGHIQVAAIGISEGALENNLRDLAERHAGAFLAEEKRCEGNLGMTCTDDASCGADGPCQLSALSLEKFFITAFGLIFAENSIADPMGALKAGQRESADLEIPICDEQNLTVTVGFDPIVVRDDVVGATAAPGRRICDARVELFTPSGQPVDRTDSGVEHGHGNRHDFVRVPLPYKGESKGTWVAKVVRDQPDNLDCPDQQFFWSASGRGYGKVDPWVERPEVVSGQPILASFRIPEPQRPPGGFAQVKGTVTLTRPDLSTETLDLFDDGTHGDRAAGNNMWSARFSAPAGDPGAYHLHGRFEMTYQGCTRVREAEYSIVVQEEPDPCAIVPPRGVVRGHGWSRPQPGDVLDLGALVCVRNGCREPDRYRVSVSDSLGWLKVRDPATGTLSDPPASFETAELAGFARECHLGEDQNLVAVVPPDAAPGDSTGLTITVASLAHPDQVTVTSDGTVQVYPPPDCNKNGVSDLEDIANGTSLDEDDNRVPDECQQWHTEVPRGDQEEEPDDGIDRQGCWVLALVFLVLLIILWLVLRSKPSTP